MTYRKNLYGYRIVSGEITVVPDEKAVVERIAGLYIAGASYQTIADSLNKAGTLFSSEAPLWNKHKVKRLLENPRYTGTKGYPAILDRDQLRSFRRATTFPHNSGKTMCAGLISVYAEKIDISLRPV